MSEPVIPNEAPAGRGEIDRQYITRSEVERMERIIQKVVCNYVDKGVARFEKEIQGASNEIKNIRQTQQWCTDTAIKPDKKGETS